MCAVAVNTNPPSVFDEERVMNQCALRRKMEAPPDVVGYLMEHGVSHDLAAKTSHELMLGACAVCNKSGDLMLSGASEYDWQLAALRLCRIAMDMLHNGTVQALRQASVDTERGECLESVVDVDVRTDGG